MSEMPICQSCGMPMDSEDLRGFNRDGSRSEDYCMYCFMNGHFTRDITMDEMIQTNIKFLDEWIQSTGIQMTEEEAIEQLKLYLPTLKRWKS
jgi:hypothetical protein